MTPADVIQRFAAVARPVILQFFPANSCIASTRIAIEVLARFGVTAEAVPVGLVVQVKARKLAYVCGIDIRHLATVKRPASQPWDGHVVAVAGKGAARWLIDASFDQASMPDHGVEIPPFVLVVPVRDRKLASKNIGVWLTLETDDGEKISVRYMATRNQTFRQSPAWETDHLQPAIAMICERLKSSDKVLPFISQNA